MPSEEQKPQTLLHLGLYRNQTGLLFLTTEYAESVVAVTGCLIVAVTTRHFCSIGPIESSGDTTFLTAFPSTGKAVANKTSIEFLDTHIIFVTTINLTAQGFTGKIDSSSKRTVCTGCVARIQPIQLIGNITCAEVQHFTLIFRRTLGQ